MLSKYENLSDEARVTALTKQAEHRLDVAVGNILRVLANGGDSMAIYHQMEEAVVSMYHLEEAEPYAADGIFRNLHAKLTPELFDETSRRGCQSEVIRQSLRCVAGELLEDATRHTIARQSLEAAVKRYKER